MKKAKIHLARHVGIGGFTDADLLRQVLHNLLGNALRYAHSKIEVALSEKASVPVVTISNDCERQMTPRTSLGLGLRLVHGICASTGMRIETQTLSGEFIARLRIDNFA